MAQVVALDGAGESKGAGDDEDEDEHAPLEQYVTVPARGAGPGDSLMVQTANGMMRVTIPAGLKPGQQFRISASLDSGNGAAGPAAAPEKPALTQELRDMLRRGQLTRDQARWLGVGKRV